MENKKIVVYFHGYKGSIENAKVERLKLEKNLKVFAFPIDIDPILAEVQVCSGIDSILVDNMHTKDDLVFVGTSLGAWLAAELAMKYDCKAILINPSNAPQVSLKKFDLPLELLKKYGNIKESKKFSYFFVENDNVIPNHDYRNVLKLIGAKVFVIEDADHRFEGKAFEHVVEYIKKLK